MKCKLSFAALGIAIVFLVRTAGAVQPGQRKIEPVESMARMPRPLEVRDWRSVARDYYTLVLNPNASGKGFPVVAIEPNAAGFRIKSYLGANFDQEGFTALAAVVGAGLVGLDARSLHGVDFVERAKAWYDPAIGVYRHRPNQHDPVLSADIYGYWDVILGLMLAAQYPEDPELKNQARTAVEAFRQIAHGLGCPKSPNFDVLGWDFAEGKPRGRMEPMNRLGNAPSVAWVLLVGYQITGDKDDLDCARAAMKW